MEPLATKADLATATGLEETDPIVALALKRASGRFRDNVGHPVSFVEDDEIWLDGDGSTELLLPAFPVKDVTVTLDGQDLVGGRAYKVNRQHGKLVSMGRWPIGVENIRVVYSHGYEPVPEGVEDAVLEHATTLALSLAHVQQETAGASQVGYGAAALVGVTQKWVEAVNRYKVRGRA